MTQNTTNSPNNIDNATEKFDTKGLFLAYLKHWKWFAISVFICISFAIFKIASTIPSYQVEASIYLAGNSEDVSSAMSLTQANPLVAMKSYIDESELEVMKSRNNVSKIVDTLGLCYSYFMEGTLKDIPLYKNYPVVAEFDSTALHNLQSNVTVSIKPLSNGKYDISAKTKFQDVKESIRLTDADLPADVELSYGTLRLTRNDLIPEFEGTEIIKIKSPKSAAKDYANALSIEFAKNSDHIIRLSLKTTIEQRGNEFIKTLLDLYNRNIIEEKNRSAVQTEAFIIDRLVMISSELKDVENRLQAYRQQHNITDIETQSKLNLNLKSTYESQLAEIDADIALLDEIEQIINKSGAYELLPAAVKETTISHTIEQYNLRINQLNRILEGSTPNNPLVASMQSELARDKVKIAQSIATSRSNLKSKRDNITMLENQSRGQLASTPTIDKGLQEIFREQQVKVNIYTFLLQRREEIALQKTLATNTARLIDDPISDEPVSPRKLLILAFWLLFGLIIPAGIIYLRRTLFPTFSDKDDLERITAIPILGEITSLKKAENNEIVVKENDSSSVSELYRLLRANLSMILRGDKKVILVTSAISGEGKTFISTNLAMTYAISGKRVCVVGMDIRRPVLARKFGLNNAIGVTTFLSGHKTDISEIVHQSKQSPNLYILTAGPMAPNPNELLLSENMELLFDQLRAEFDVIIVDSAPIGLVSDSFLILPYSDVQLFVARADYSTQGGIKLLQQGIDTGKFNNAYIVLNGVDMDSSAYSYRRFGKYTYSSSSRRTYGYGYGNK